MAVANAWATRHSPLPPSHLRPASPSQETCPLSKKSYWISLPNKNLHIKSNKSTLSCHCSSNFESSDRGSNNKNSYSSTCSSSSSSAEWDWDRWTRHFSEVEEAESSGSLLKFQLEDAIEKEDFQEAAKLKIAIKETTLKDSVAEIMYQLKNAIDDERYHDASTLCQNKGCGLVGWWVGYSKASDDPFGRLVRITPGTGRFVGRSYSPRQLVNSSPGTPLFEIFLVKDTNEMYKIQVVLLDKIKRNAQNSNSSSDSTKGISATGVENASVIDSVVEESIEGKSRGKSIDLEGDAEEGIRRVINFLKEKIPELKVKMMKVNVTEDITEDTLKQLIGDDNKNTTNEDNEEDGSETMEDENNYDTKLYIREVLHNKEDTPTKDEFVRVPADIKDMGRDSFVFHIPNRNQDKSSEENIFLEVDAEAASRNIREIVKLAVSQAQKQNRLSEYTNFSRITTSKGDIDPFDGLYVGAFGPYGTEVVQLKRKYGNWNTNNDEKSSDIEFFEYVEAVKLTGDLNVPAGEVTFRAKIGKGNHLTNRGIYPDELGVVTSYSGQGRIAEFGFRNPKWVEGELLQLNGKGMVEGADLGFLYVVPEQSFLILFDCLKLPE